MSFALEVKEEILSHVFTESQAKAFLAGFIKYNGELIWNSDREKLKLSSISNKVARSIFALCKKYFPGHIEIAVSQSQLLKQNKTFYISLIGNIASFLKSINVFDEHNTKLVEFKPTIEIKKKDELIKLKRAYIAGIFVAIGSVNSPKTTNYHLELQFKDFGSAEYWKILLSEFGFDFKTLQRSEKIYLAYIKKSVLVSDFLKLVDSYNCVMYFENQRIEREMSNNINRANNIDISNERKTLTVGLEQVEQISKIQANIATHKLSSKARVLAELRVTYPDASYNELTEMMIDLGFSITKSGISNLFKIIKKLSLEFK